RLFARRPRVTVITAMQGSMAIELAREHQPELVILDLHLPDMDGAEVLRRLRTDPRTAAIPVVMLTADATARQRERLLRAGAHAYLTKPVAVRELLALVDGVLDASALAGDPR
ncbi:MAG: PleD family two-component system response regulator, partial [Candidatus Dormibacteria bacterium]